MPDAPTSTTPVHRYFNGDGLAFGPIVRDIPETTAYRLMQAMHRNGDWFSDFFSNHPPIALVTGQVKTDFFLWTERHVYFLKSSKEVGWVSRCPLGHQPV